MFICTLGDPLSVNVELVSKLLRQTLNKNCFKNQPCVLIGSFYQWSFQEKSLGLKCTDICWKMIKNLKEVGNSGFHFLDIEAPRIDPRKMTFAECGALARQALECLIDFKPEHKIAVLTCPINKFNCQKAGFKFSGQTEFFESIWNSNAIMILAGEKLRVGLVTNHVPIKDLSLHLSQEVIFKKIFKFRSTLQKIFMISEPKIAVCGFNPHCGENGLLGQEEEKYIDPAVRAANNKLQGSKGLVTGPLSADVVFWQTLQGHYDGVLAMYHDQGLGPLKTVCFEDAVNISGGLPYLRISPDHGPASDIFLENKASQISFKNAFNECMTYLKAN